MNRRARDNDPAREPWWRVGMVWLVVAGPLMVVVAGIVTAVIAVRGADEVLDTRADVEQAGSAAVARTPALEARNHAATPAPAGR